jgi:hypothetical protein
MTGPEHYRRAEQLIAEAREAIAPVPGFTPIEPGKPTSSELHERAMAEAHVHALLALASATVLGDVEKRAWRDAASPDPAVESPFGHRHERKRHLPLP